MKRILLFAMAIALIIPSGIAQSLNKKLHTAKYRQIGPFRGGRSVSSSGVIGDPFTYYMGTTGGGLWKTTDAGQTWKNISDGYFKTGSVGAVAVSESHPNVVYIGMGEHAPRGVMTSHGDGVYKSTDAGKTWQHIGLEATQHISRIIIHPDNPDILYVAAQGALHGNNQDRGVYKSLDGGSTWSKILYVNDMTGAVELSLDYSNPEVLYAAMWEHQRKPWKVISGGPGSGLYKTTNGGKTWNKIHKGLPKEMGKMAISVSRANPEKVYALIESDTEKDLGGLFVSNNGGDSWKMVSGDNRLTQRAWYYIEVFTDPQDEHTVYVLSAPALRSIDGGKTWERLTGTHGDFHDLWINPKDSKNMVISNDGGAGITFNRGETWATQDNMATAQFYRVNADNLFPYNIYGGQQDNTSVKIASSALDRGSISEQNWTYSAGGESAFLAFDPDDPQYVLGGSYLGTIEVYDHQAQAGTKIMAAPIQYLGRDSKDMKYRFNWNAPIIWSKHEPGTFYHGAQLLLRTRDMGKTWDEVSPDLTRNEKEKQGKMGGPYTNEAVGAENYGTLSYVVESPHEKGHIWTGSDDGLVYLTKDGGETWKNVTPKGLEECLINAIEVSPHDPATVYIATTRYKFNDKNPGIYKTTNYGRSWTKIDNGIPNGAFTRVVREDNKVKDLLYAGTETGMYISYNGGKSWTSLQLNLPVVPITDLLVKHSDLIVATAGRSFWVLDDLELIRQYKGEISDLHIYKPEDAILGNWYSELNGNSTNFKGTRTFDGVNPANGVVFYYHLPDSGKINMTIKNAEGKVVRTFSSKIDKNFQGYAGGPPADPVLGNKKGINRFVWDMRYPTMNGIPNAYIEASYRGHKASPGVHTAEINLNGKTVSTQFNILANPGYDVSKETYQEYHDFMLSMENEVIAMHKMTNDIYRMKNQLTNVVNELPEGSSEIADQCKTLIRKMTQFDEDMIQRKSKAYDDVENFPNKFTANFMFLINQTESDIPRVNQPHKELHAALMKEWSALKKRGEDILQKDVVEINKLLWDAGVGVVR